MAYRRNPIIAPPWGGWDNSQPSMVLPPNSFKSIKGWIIDKGRLQPFPKLNNFGIPPNNRTVLGARTFQDATNLFHTVILTEDQGYYLTAGAVYNSIGSWTGFSSDSYATEVFESIMFFTNGCKLRYTNGEATSTVVSLVPGGSFYLGKLAGHLIMLNTIEDFINYKVRVRYSANNNALQWDPVADFTAGVFDVQDIEDQITGWAVIRNVGFIFHSFGITSMTPTGNAQVPFFLENYAQGPQGAGNYFQGALASYGEMAVAVAIDDVYAFNSAQMIPIGGKAKKQIFSDLNAKSNDVCAQMFGTLNGGRDYLSYWLGIPMAFDTVTSLWIFNFDQQVWFNMQIPGAIRTIASVFTA